MNFRTLDHDDLPELARLEVGGARRPWGVAEMEEALRGEDVRAFVAVGRKGEALAYCVYDLEDEALFVVRLLVGRRYRRGGLGRAVLRRLVDKIALSRRRSSLRALVYEDDLDTCYWLAGMGFSSRLLRSRDGPDKIEFAYRVEEYAGHGD